MNAPYQVQGSPEWHDFKKLRIGSSESATILGINNYCTPYTLWLEKTGRKPPRETTYAMTRGVELEPIARQRFIEETGIFITPRVMVHPKYDYLIASLDGISDGMNIVEIKCPSRSSISHQMALRGDVLDVYQCQMQHQCLVTGADMIYYYSFDGQEGVLLKVYRDDKFIENLLHVEQEFYQHLINDTPPPLTDKDYLDFSDNEAFVALAKEYSATKTQLKALEERREALGNALMALANKQPCKGGGIRIQHYHRKGSVDYSKIPELKGVDLDFYRKDGTDVWSIVND